LDTYKNPRDDRRLRSLPLYALYVEIFPGWSIRDICVRILTLLNHGDRRGKSKNLLLRTWEALIEFGVETLIVDHADEVTRKALISIIRLSLGKETRISLILAGSTELESRLIKEDLDSFFESCHEFSALSYVDFANVSSYYDDLNLKRSNVYPPCSLRDSMASITARAKLYSLSKIRQMKKNR
jgi:hypothetical protein